MVHSPRFRRRNPRVVVALAATASTCLCQLRSSLMVTTRYFPLSTISRVWPWSIYSVCLSCLCWWWCGWPGISQGGTLFATFVPIPPRLEDLVELTPHRHRSWWVCTAGSRPQRGEDHWWRRRKAVDPGRYPTVRQRQHRLAVIMLPSSITCCFLCPRNASIHLWVSIEAELIQKPLMRYLIKGLWKYQGPVVQSVVSLTSSLRIISLTVLADSIYNILIFFAEKLWVAFAVQKLLTFFQQKLSAYLRITRCKF